MWQPTVIKNWLGPGHSQRIHDHRLRSARADAAGRVPGDDRVRPERNRRGRRTVSRAPLGRPSKIRAAFRRSSTGGRTFSSRTSCRWIPRLPGRTHRPSRSRLPPFNLFPPGYQNAQFPVARVTHTHGLVVLPQMDGTAERVVHERPVPRSELHDQGLHDAERSAVDAALLSRSRARRDPPRRLRRRGRRRVHDSGSQRTALDGPSSPLPKGQFEVLLAFATRAFFTDGQPSLPARPGHAERRSRRAAEHRLLVVQRGSRHRGGQRQGVAEPERPAPAIPLPNAGGREHAALGYAVRQSGEPRHRPRSRSSARTADTCRRRRCRPTSSSASPSAPTSWSTSPSSRAGTKIQLNNLYVGEGSDPGLGTGDAVHRPVAARRSHRRRSILRCSRRGLS